VHLAVQASFSEQLLQRNVNAPPDVCQLSPDACAHEAHPFVAGATLTVPLWTGLTIEANIARTRWLERAAAYQKSTLVSDLAREVAAAYWEVRRVEELRDLLARVRQRHQEVEELTRSRVDAGITSRADYTRAHTLVLRDSAALTELEARVIEARAQLGAALQIDDTIVLTEPTDGPVAPPPTVDALLTEAAGQRPELRLAGATIEAQKQAVRAAKGPYWPQISISGQALAANQRFYSSLYAMPSFSGVEERVVLDFSVALNLQWSIFDTLTTWTQVRDAELARDQLVAERARRETEVRAEVRATHGRLGKAIVRHKWLQQAAAASRESVDLLRKRYRAGTALLIEVLGAEAELTQVESDLIDSDVAIVEAEADLAHALGRPYRR
jgi:outer membrane protein TolC